MCNVIVQYCIVVKKDTICDTLDEYGEKQKMTQYSILLPNIVINKTSNKMQKSCV